MITKMRMRNWRSHQESEMDFTSGTNALMGIIGSGKSSVLDAMCFCLFGTFPNLQARKLKIEDLIMKKPVQKDKAEIEVFFKENGKEYYVKRVIERGKGTTHSEVRENGKTIESPNTSRVNELVEKILKVNYELFSKAIYSDQNSLDYFLKIPSGQRMKKIDDLLGIEKFEKARANSVSLTNKILERRAGRMSLLEGVDVQQIEKNMQEIRDSIANLRSEGIQLDRRMRDAAVERSRMEREMGDARKVREKIEELRREEKGTNDVINDTYASLKKLEESLKGASAESAERDLREVVRNLGDMESVLKEEQRRYGKLQDQAIKSRTEVEIMQRDKIARLQRDLDVKTRAKEELKKRKAKPEEMEEEIDEKKAAVEKFEAEMEFMKIRVKELQETIDEINKVEGKCPTCDSKMTEEKKVLLIKKRQFEVEKMKEKWAKAAEKNDITKKELAQLEAEAKDLGELLEAVKDLDKTQTELDNIMNVYSVLKQQTEEFDRDLHEARRIVESVEMKLADSRSRKEGLEIAAMRARDYEEKRGKIESLIMKRKQVESSIAALQEAVEGKENEEMEEKWKALVSEEKEIGARIHSIADMVREREARLKEIEVKSAAAMKAMEEIRRLDKIVEDLKVFGKALESTQIQLRKEFVASVNYTMNELWPNLYPYQDFTCAQLSIEEGDYVLQLQEKSGKWVNVEGFASGGERSIAALTLRIAFALVLAPQLRWLVLDEPTANMDVKAVEDLATTLSEHIGNFIDQTFLITHDEKLEKAVTGYAYRLERDKAKEEFTRVVQL